MADTYIPPDPPGYCYAGPLFADLDDKYQSPDRLIVEANLFALVPLSIGVVLLWLPYQLYHILGRPWALLPNFALPLPAHIALWAGMLVTSMLTHELLHVLILKLAGNQPRIAWYGGMLLAGLPDGEYLTRRVYLIMSLTPVLSLSLLGTIALILLPSVVARPLLVALLLNLAASIGDLMVATRVRRWPPNSVFTDDRGIRVFVRVV